MTTRICILAWEISWAEEPGGLPSTVYSPWGCKRIRHNLGTKQQKPLIIKYCLLTMFVQFSGSKYIHVVVQFSPSISQIFLLPKLNLSPDWD